MFAMDWEASGVFMFARSFLTQTVIDGRWRKQNACGALAFGGRFGGVDGG